MFEKEAENFADSKGSFWKQGRTCIDSVRQAFQKGAEFGYNKAREWIYCKDKLPEDESDVLCLLGKEESEIGYFHQEKNRWYTIDGKEVTPIAWTLIQYPKE